MDIAGMSTMLSQAKVSQQANTKMMEQSVNPNLGKNIDVRL